MADNILFNTGDPIGGKYEAFCRILLKEARTNRCDNCFGNIKQTDTTFTCTDCHVAQYCTSLCQSEHLNIVHSSECSCALYRYSARSDVSEIIWETVAMHHALRVAQRKQDNYDPQYKLIDGQTCNFLQLYRNLDWFKDTEVVQACNVLDKMVRDQGFQLESGYFILLFSIFRGNCFPVILDNKHSGYVFYPEVSGFLHSCRPNAHRHIEKYQLQVRAIQTILKGTIPSISYLPFDYKDFEERVALATLLKRQCIISQCSNCQWMQARENVQRYKRLQENHEALEKIFRECKSDTKWENIQQMHNDTLGTLHGLVSDYDHPITMQYVNMTLLARSCFKKELQEAFLQEAEKRVRAMAGVDSDLYRSLF